MGRTVRIDDLANEVMEGLQEYADLATDSMKAAVKKAGNTVKTDITANAPERTGRYSRKARNWTPYSRTGRNCPRTSREPP